MKVTAKVTASPAAMELLAKLPDVMQKGPVLAKALTAGAAVVLARAKQLTPKGDPAHNPKAKPLIETEAAIVRKYDTSVLAVIGPQYPAGAHGHLVEGGTKPHMIGAKNKHGLSVATPTGRIWFGKSVQHRGSKLHQFLQPAIDETAGQTEAAIIRVISEEIERAISGN